MPLFKFDTDLTFLISYVIDAETLEEARIIARERIPLGDLNPFYQRCEKEIIILSCQISKEEFDEQLRTIQLNLGEGDIHSDYWLGDKLINKRG